MKSIKIRDYQKNCCIFFWLTAADCYDSGSLSRYPRCNLEFPYIFSNVPIGRADMTFRIQSKLQFYSIVGKDLKNSKRIKKFKI